MEKAPRVGDRVIIHFGGGELEAEVVRVSQTFTPPHVEVEFFLDDRDDEPVRSMYSIDHIRPAPVPSS